MQRYLASFGCGVLFGLGLAISQMINPSKVLAFLDIAGDWDPSLALVMASALLIAGVAFRFVLRNHRPLFADVFQLPSRKDIDVRLVVGAALFGVGWGLAGYCPGPAIAALALTATQSFQEPIIFVLSLLAGAYSYNKIG